MLINMMDIYYKVDSSIVNQGFWQKDVEGKKSLIEQELKNYILFKIAEIDKSKSLVNSSLENVELIDLLEILASIIPKEKHFDTLRHFIHYILNVAGNLQNYSIIWWEEEDSKLENNPLIDFDENGIWNSLTTLNEEEHDYVKIFIFVYDVFKNKFMVHKNQTKVIINKSK